MTRGTGGSFFKLPPSPSFTFPTFCCKIISQFLDISQTQFNKLKLSGISASFRAIPAEFRENFDEKLPASPLKKRNQRFTIYVKLQRHFARIRKIRGQFADTHTHAKIGFDTAENGPSKIWVISSYTLPSNPAPGSNIKLC